MMYLTKPTLILLSFFVFVFSSCKKENTIINPRSDYLVGVWVNPVYSDSTIIFERSAQLPDNNYGLSFESTGKLVERKNISWCGTPPISYGDYEGNWSEKDSIVQINVGFWGGEAELRWKVLSVDNNSLTVWQMYVDYGDL